MKTKTLLSSFTNNVTKIFTKIMIDQQLANLQSESQILCQQSTNAQNIEFLRVRESKIQLQNKLVSKLETIQLPNMWKLLRILNFDFDHVYLFAQITARNQINVDMNNVVYISKLLQNLYPNKTWGKVLTELQFLLESESKNHNKYCIMRFMIMWIQQQCQVYNIKSYDKSMFDIEKHIQRFDAHTYLSQCDSIIDLQLKNIISQIIGFKIFGFQNKNNQNIYEKQWLNLIFENMDQYCCISPEFKYQDDFLCLQNCSNKSIQILNGEQATQNLTADNHIYDVFSYLNSNKTIVLSQKVQSLCLYCLKDWCSFQLSYPNQLKSISLSSCHNISLKSCTNLTSVGLYSIEQFNPQEFQYLTKLNKLYCNSINIKMSEMTGDTILQSIKQCQNLQILYILNCKFSKRIVIDFSIKELNILVLYYGNLQEVEIDSDKCQCSQLEIIHLSLPNTNSASASLKIRGTYNLPSLSFVCCKNEKDYQQMIYKCSI